mgnify:CR=1 FL=1
MNLLIDIVKPTRAHHLGLLLIPTVQKLLSLHLRQNPQPVLGPPQRLRRRDLVHKPVITWVPASLGVLMLKKELLLVLVRDTDELFALVCAAVIIVIIEETLDLDFRR